MTKFVLRNYDTNHFYYNPLKIARLIRSNKQNILENTINQKEGLRSALDISPSTAEKLYNILYPDKPFISIFNIFESVIKNKEELMNLLILCDKYIALEHDFYQKGGKDRKTLDEFLKSNKSLKYCVEKNIYPLHYLFINNCGLNEDQAKIMHELITNIFFPYSSKFSKNDLDINPFEKIISNSVFIFLDNRKGNFISNLLYYDMKSPLSSLTKDFPERPGYTDMLIIKPLKIINVGTGKILENSNSKILTYSGQCWSGRDEEIAKSLRVYYESNKKYLGIIMPYTFLYNRYNERELFFIKSSQLSQVVDYVNNISYLLNRPGIIGEIFDEGWYH